MISRVLPAVAALGLVASGTAKVPQAQLRVPPRVPPASDSNAFCRFFSPAEITQSTDGRRWPPPPATAIAC